MNIVPFNKPYLTGNELSYIEQSHERSQLAGDGAFTSRCHRWLEEYGGSNKALLTHSCTAALEMSAHLLEIQPGDEVILPSYTFVSTANAFVLRGAVPVFVDIRNDTLNIDESLLEQAITPKTKAIVPVHYAGVACEMDTIGEIAQSCSLAVVEDAAQGVLAYYKGRPLGTIGDLGTFSFHETKNVIAGEGGALLVNRSDLSAAAEIIREKGTDRSQFFRGHIDKYTWQSVGSSYLPGEIIAAFLWAQLEQAQAITEHRLAAWTRYHRLFDSLESQGAIRRPMVPEACQHNGHMYYLILPNGVDRSDFLNTMSTQGVNAVFHYVPLHSSPAGSRYGRVAGNMKNTSDLAARLVRLPLWVGIDESLQQRVYDSVVTALKAQKVI